MPRQFIKFTKAEQKTLLSDITVPQAAEKLGISPSTVQRYRKRHGFVSSHKKNKIDEELMAQVASLRNTCSVKQCAEFLGVPYSRVRTICGRLSATGDYGYQSKWIPMPWIIPASGVLVAKSCKECGNILSARWFHKGRNSWSSKCKKCASTSERSRLAKTQVAELEAKKQFISRKLATKYNEPWDEAEIRALAEEDKTVFQKAIELGRTYYAAKNQVRIHGLAKDRSLGDPTQEAWIIHWLRKHEEQRELFKRLGPVAESEWDWNDVA